MCVCKANDEDALYVGHNFKPNVSFVHNLPMS